MTSASHSFGHVECRIFVVFCRQVQLKNQNKYSKCPNRWATKDIKIRCKSHFYFFWCVGNINSVIIGGSHCSQHLYQIPYSSPDFHRNIERNNWKNEIITFYIFTQIRTGVTNLMKCWLLWDVLIITALIFVTHQLKKTIMKLSWDFLQRGNER